MTAEAREVKAGPAVEWQVGSCAADAPTRVGQLRRVLTSEPPGGLLPSEMATGSHLSTFQKKRDLDRPADTRLSPPKLNASNCEM